jgi:hypothetical protein
MPTVNFQGASMHDHESNSPKTINNFEIALRMRDFEIAQLTTRNNFFMIFQGVLFAGLVQSSHQKPIVSLMVCVVGFVVAIFQIGMASGAKFWQEYWEQMLSKYEGDARSAKPELFHDETSQYEKTVKDRMQHRGFSGLASKLVMCRFSVSRIPIYVGIALSAVWGLLILCTLRGYPPLAVPAFVVGF